MFLHETGDDSDSYSRADLSSLNAASTQRLAPAAGSSSSKPNNQIASFSQQSPQTASLPAAASSSSQMVKPEAMSRSDSTESSTAKGGDGSALPTTANWAKNPQIEQSRRSSQGASRATPSPKTTQSKLAVSRSQSRSARSPSTAPPETKSKAPQEPSSSTEAPSRATKSKQPLLPTHLALLLDAFKSISNADFTWSLDRNLYDQATLDLIDNYPPLIDPNGGLILQLKKRQEEDTLKEEAERAEQNPSIVDEEENLAGGSLQLGGEPEHGDTVLGAASNSRRQTPFGLFSNDTQPFDRQASIGAEFSSLGAGGRSLTPQQQRNISLLKSGNQQTDLSLEQNQRSGSTNTSQHHPQLSNPFQTQNQQFSALSRHGRQASRYSFANDLASGSTAIKPSASTQLMAQQSVSVMPHTQQQKGFPGQQGTQPNLHSSFYSGVQGPPPGLKASGTPPISGGGMFGQGHGFANAVVGGANYPSNTAAKSNEDSVRDLMRGRLGGGSAVGADIGKRESRFLPHPDSTYTPSPPPNDLAPGSHINGPLFGHQSHHVPKPRKTGKRHRHANTSSFGGGATVDLADPGILQARMHHSGVGQGPYGGAQSQGGYNSHGMMYGGGGGGFGGRW